MGGSLQGNPLSLSTVVSTVSGTLGTSGSVNSDLTSSTFCFPWGITTKGSEIFYLTDAGRNLIRKIDITNNTVTTLAGNATNGSTDGYGTSAYFSKPTGIVIKNLELYVSDTGNHTIRKIVISTGQVTTIVGFATYVGYTSGLGTSARLNTPTGITTDQSDLFFCDSGNNVIRKVELAASNYVTLVGGYAGRTGTDDGVGTFAKFNNPQGITTDGTYLYVSDTGNHTIRKINISTNEVTTLAGSAGYSGYSDGTGTGASFFWPMDITSDGTYLYVADRGNNLIRRVHKTTGEVTTMAGVYLKASFKNDTGVLAEFSGPIGMTNDASKVYVVDTQNQLIRLIE